jgi:hypothetical protein
MGQSNNKSEPKQEPKPKQELEPKQEPKSKPIVKKIDSLPDEIFLCIFGMLDMDSMGVVVITCRKFNLLYESNKTLIMKIKYIMLCNGFLDEQWVDKLKYPLKLLCRELGLLPWPKFNLAVQREEIKSSTECYKKAILWINEEFVTYEAFQAFQQFVSECPDASILIFEGDPVSFQCRLSPISCKYLCISGGCLLADWSKFINGIKGLQWVYFKPGGLHNKAVTWFIDTKTTLFIMDSIEVKEHSGDIK